MDLPFVLGEIDPEVVTLFTDGSCYPNPNGKGGWAYGGMWREHYSEKSGHLPSTTNNQAELVAVQMALQSVDRLDLPMCIVTDSQYVYKAFRMWIPIWKECDWLTAIGETVANAVLIRSILELIETRTEKVDFKWTKGHTKAATPFAQFNARADELASGARRNG